MDDIVVELAVFGFTTLIGILGLIITVVETMDKEHGQS